MPILSTTGAGSLKATSPNGGVLFKSKFWSNSVILSNQSANVIFNGLVYTSSSQTSLHNTVVYKNSSLTQKLNDTFFRIGSNYFYADSNGWTIGVHNFNGPGDTYITGPKSILDIRTDNCTIEMFVYAKSLPSWEYSAYLSVGEPAHCQRIAAFFGSSNGGIGSRNLVFTVDYKQQWGSQFSKINPGMEFIGMCSQMISPLNDSETPMMYEGFTREAWHHVAMTRNNGVIRLYFNGVLKGIRNFTTVNCDWNATTLLERPLAIGSGAFSHCPNPNPTGMWNGYMSDVRVVKGQALYIGSAFPVPLRPLTAAGHRGGSQNITGEIRLLALQDTMSKIGPSLERVFVGS
jgi:hypothetical protein